MPDKDNPRYQAELRAMQERSKARRDSWSPSAGADPGPGPQGVKRRRGQKGPGPVPVKRRGGLLRGIFGSKSNGKGFGR